MKTNAMLAVAAALSLLVAERSHAVGVSPSQELLIGMVDNTLGFGATQMSTITNTVENAGGVAYLVDWDDTGESFTRVVLQGENFNADLSAFDSFDLQFTPFAEDIGVKPYVQTGDGFQFFETAFTSIAVADGPTVVSLDLNFVANIDNVRQFGYQIFGPAGGVSSTVLVQPAPGSTIFNPVPEPTAGMLAALGMLVGWRRRR